MTPLQRKWEDILASHGLPAEDGGDTALNRAMFFGNPDNFEEENDDFSTFMDTIEEPNPWVLDKRAALSDREPQLPISRRGCSRSSR